MLIDLLLRHIITIFMIILFSIKIWNRKSFRNMETNNFWLTIISVLVLVVEDILESYAAENTALWYWRVLLSIIGYTFRSTAALGLLFVIVPNRKHSFLLWLPCLITLFTCGTAYFTDIAFSYDDAGKFHRGPLGYVVFIVPLIYLILIVWYTFSRIADKKGAEKFIIPLSGLFCLTAAICDAKVGGTRINEAYLISSIFFYMFLYSNDYRHDVLTGLLNRQAFYDDCKQFSKEIGAIASLDMNGLKELNDTKGHQAGDVALRNIGECLKSFEDHNTQAYRIGGDEFIILFFHDHEDMIDIMKQQIKDDVIRRGYTISVGHSMISQNSSLAETVKESDRMMYEDKKKFYRETGRVRR